MRGCAVAERHSDVNLRRPARPSTWKADPLHVLQELSKHAEPGGWYEGRVEEFLTMHSIIEGCRDEAVARELAGTHGLWEDLSEYIRMPGICAFFTGAAGTCCFLLCV